ncbi:MAG TPA: MFS transporter [Vicinamibacterales bacterium]|nr:MFS transporter [Vicinamibacterales bacterium]
MVSWRRNLFAVTAASFIGFTGFTLVMPFLPLYFRELGVDQVGEIALWSGLSLGVTPAITALMAPFWGRLADRVGRKIMVERSLASFVVVMAAMAFVTRAWHVLALRAIQGLFAGYGALALTMAADSTPRERMAQAIGIVQIAQRLGPALGPVIGGTVAQIVGLRQAFLVTSSFYLGALILVLSVYREGPPRKTDAAAGDHRITFRNVLAFENFVILMAVVFGLQFVDRSFGPVLPLYIAELGTPVERVPIVSGVLFSMAAGTAALGNHVSGRLLRRLSARLVIAGAAAAAALGTLVYVLAGSAGLLLAGTPIFGVGIGVAMTAAYTAAGTVIPASGRGAGFGLLTTASLTGLALSPILSGMLSAVSIRAVFLLDTAALLVLAGLVRRLMAAAPLAATTAPTTEEV